ncbi:hypothetical protein, partial [Acinetobacter baumannii]|uniref:hypothetical protein n=1 Tax=Acinetobacter baumannii TaxID=470 RepID=UPI003399D0C0
MMLSVLSISLRHPSGVEHNSTRRTIRRELKRSLKRDREAWWSQKADEMEQAHSSGNIRKLFQLIRATGAKRLGVSETICERDGSLIHNKQRRLARWAEHFQDQFSWPAASNALVCSRPTTTWLVDMEAPSVTEVSRCISALKRFKSAGPDDLAPTLVKECGEILCTEVPRLFQLIWEKETVPNNWGESIVVP